MSSTRPNRHADNDGVSHGVDLSLDHVTKRFTSGGTTITATDDVTLEVTAGATVALVGTSGSGKSTLLHLLGAMDTPDGGTVRVGDAEVGALRGRALSEYRASVGFVFQRFHLLPALSVLDNVLAPLMPRRVQFDRRARAMELLDAVGLADRAHALPSRLSGGQQQRVAIARALVVRPPLVLADEPTGNLDSTTGAAVLDVLFALQEDSGATVVVATHDAQIAARCQRMIRLRDGAVIEDLDLEPPPTDQLLDQIGRLDSR